MTQSGNWYASSGSPAPSACLQYTANGALNLLTFSVVIDESWDEDAEVTEHPVETGAGIADHVRVALVKCSLKVFNSNEPIVSSVNLATYADQPTRGAYTLQVPIPTWTAKALTLIYPTWDNPIQERALLQEATGAVGSAVGGTAGGAIGSAAGGLLGAFLLSAKEVDVAQATTAGLVNPPAPTSLAANVDQWPGQTDYVAAMHTLLSELKSAAQPFTVLGTKKTLAPMVIETLSFSRTSETGSGENLTIGLKEIRQVSTMTVPAPIPNLPAGGGKPVVSHGGQDPTPAPQAEGAFLGFLKAVTPLSAQAELPSVFGQ